MGVRPERQRLEVDLGILPDLGVDQAAEQPFEQPLQQTFPRKGAITADRLFQSDVTLGPRIDHPNPLRIASIPYI